MAPGSTVGVIGDETAGVIGDGTVDGTMAMTDTNVDIGLTFACSGVQFMDSTNGIFLFLDLDYENNIAYIAMFGPADQYFAMGFGSNTMNDTYTIVVNGYGTAQERRLGM